MNMMTKAPAAERLWAILPTLERREIGEAVETLIAWLDAIDGDPDLEEDDHSGDPMLDAGEGDDAHDGAFADAVAYQGHKRRIQRTRCARQVVGDPRSTIGQWPIYTLHDPAARAVRGRVL